MARKDGGRVEFKMRYRKEMLLEKEKDERENKQEQGNKSIIALYYKRIHYNQHNEAIPGLHRLMNIEFIERRKKNLGKVKRKKCSRE